MTQTLERATFNRTERPLQYALLRNVRWETYEALLHDHLDRPWPRFVFDRGTLEIMTPSQKHDRASVHIRRFFDVLAEEWGLDLDNIGHATLRSRKIGRGFEADASIYIKNAARIREKDRLDLSVDPAPDVVVEVEVTSSALDKLALYAEFKIPEVWRCDDRAATFHVLQGDAYVESSTSIALPGVTTQLVVEFLTTPSSMPLGERLRPLREWARSHRPR